MEFSARPDRERGLIYRPHCNFQIINETVSCPPHLPVWLPGLGTLGGPRWRRGYRDGSELCPCSPLPGKFKPRVSQNLERTKEISALKVQSPELFAGWPKQLVAQMVVGDKELISPRGPD